ncbi:M56 family metallopeptidase [Aureibaculum sp. 2210JD6-5]|uniref:M56 family metallopeptidase n=1 Tax=Aureibaculum sp. 2210JD6-5 TaxID=3103957 RepID=UPI002AAE4E74|nr:M56 family metallopeptidase [Aureibaculum sp. 2210JD6-5]MDY7395878.1 M56 family metallopeptidase [Aureibaculum sp. 2210JD6-5]
MLAYLLKSGVCLAVFYFFYKLLLEKEPIHIFKRIYLLGGLIMAFTIPLVTFTTIVEVEPVVFAPSTYSAIDFDPLPLQETEATPINYLPIILWTIYGFGVLLFGLKFLFNLFQINTKIRKNTKQKANRFTHVLLENLITPHTFFSYIFLNKQRYLQHQIPQEVFWHEETHAKQKHSLDVVFAELLQVVFWFNPLLYFIKKDIKLNHEFLADRAVLNKGVSLTAYQEILLAFSTNSTEPTLANALNYSSIKKRFTIMKTKTSKKAVWIKSLILLPLVVVLIYGFSKKVTIEKVFEPLTTSENLDIVKDEIRIYINENKEVTIDNRPIAFNAISTELIKISKETATDDLKIFVEVEGHLSQQLFSELEKELSKSHLPIYQIKATSLSIDEKVEDAFFTGTSFTADSLVLNLKNGEKVVGISKPEKEQQDEATQQDLKIPNISININKNKEILINGENYATIKTVKKEVERIIKNYTPNQISKIKIIIEADESIKMGFITDVKIELRKAGIRGRILNKIHSENKKHENETVSQKELSKLVQEYNKLVAKRNANKNNGNSKNLDSQLKSLENQINKELINTDKKHQDKATKEQVAEYNKLAKHYNNMPKNNMVVKLKDVERLNFIYNKMTLKQKENAEPFPNFPPPPPPVKNREEEIIEVPVKNPPPPPVPEDSTPEEKAERLKAIQKYAKENPDKVYKHKDTTGNVVEIVEMPVEESHKLPPPPPTLNQNTIEKGSKKLQEAFKKFSNTAKIYGNSVREYRSTKKGLKNIENQYKKVMELHQVYEKLATAEGVLPTPPPPPPAPPNPTDHMIEMAKQGALFYYEDKKITSDKAIELTKKNKSINIQVLGNGSSKPIVKLSKKPITVDD